MTTPSLCSEFRGRASLEPVRGREQGGHRPVLVVASAGYLDAVTTLVIVLPITTTDRRWPNYVRVEGPSELDRPSWVMDRAATHVVAGPTHGAGRRSVVRLSRTSTQLAGRLPRSLNSVTTADMRSRHYDRGLRQRCSWRSSIGHIRARVMRGGLLHSLPHNGDARAALY